MSSMSKIPLFVWPGRPDPNGFTDDGEVVPYLPSAAARPAGEFRRPSEMIRDLVFVRYRTIGYAARGILEVYVLWPHVGGRWIYRRNGETAIVHDDWQEMARMLNDQNKRLHAMLTYEMQTWVNDHAGTQ